MSDLILRTVGRFAMAVCVVASTSINAQASDNQEHSESTSAPVFCDEQCRADRSGEVDFPSLDTSLPHSMRKNKSVVNDAYPDSVPVSGEADFPSLDTSLPDSMRKKAELEKAN